MNKEHPIIFSGESVRQILIGNKTQTRRVVKMPKINPYFEVVGLNSHGDEYLMEVRQPHGFLSRLVDPKMRIKPPYFVGQRLWVKETFFDYQWCLDIRYAYRADGRPDIWRYGDKWKSPIYMPRKASRIMLEVVNVGVDRLNDISEEDCYKEGIIKKDCEYPMDQPCRYCRPCPANTIVQFMLHWNKINGKKPGCAWKDNPFVCKIEFKVVNE